MSKNPTIPDTWGISDDLANKVREALSKKSIRPEDAVQKSLEEIARDIAIIEPDPKDWGWWVTHLLELLEEEANNGRNRASFEAMLHDSRDKLDDHIKGNTW